MPVFQRVTQKAIFLAGPIYQFETTIYKEDYRLSGNKFWRVSHLQIQQIS